MYLILSQTSPIPNSFAIKLQENPPSPQEIDDVRNKVREQLLFTQVYTLNEDEIITGGIHGQHPYK